MGPRLCRDRATRRSKSGIRVRRSPQIAPPWPKLTPAGLPGRQAGAVEQEDERPQQGHQFGGVFPGRDQDCVRIGRQDDQSLGFRCAKSPQITSPRPKLTPAASLAGKLELLSEKTDAHSRAINLVAFSPDGTKIVSACNDGTIKVWDTGAPRAQNCASPWPKLTPVGLSGRQAGDAEREDGRAQRPRRVGGVLP
jgi:hypothetical protein